TIHGLCRLYLVRAADISLDLDPLLLDELVDVQHYFLRRLIGSMTAPWSPGVHGNRDDRRREDCYWYVAGLGEDRLVHCALCDMLALWKEGWASDIANLLRDSPPHTHPSLRSAVGYTGDHSRTPALLHLRMDTGTPAGTFGPTRTRTRKNRTRARVGSKNRTGYSRVPKSVWYTRKIPA
ncbi:hypothetical protein B0H13DRAFT_2413380, partial [Mycena leptocephala]